MSWFPVDDAFHSHPKARKAGMEAVGLWTLAGSHCMAYLTDGFVADWWVKEKPKGAVLAKRLVAAGLWRVGECNGESGFWFHDWKPECTKEHVLAARERARQRKAKSRESQGPSRVTGHVTDGVSPPSCLVPTQPNPTQPINSLVTSSGKGTLVDVRTSRPICIRHPIENSRSERCGDCAARREWDQAEEARRQADELAQRRERREAIDACPLCDHNGKREIRNNLLADCDHREAS